MPTTPLFWTLSRTAAAAASIGIAAAPSHNPPPSAGESSPQQQQHNTTTTTTKTRLLLSSLAPTSPIYIVCPNDHMQIAYDARTRTPLYVLERIQLVRRKDNTTNKKRRRQRHRFYEEPGLPEEFRSRNEDYKCSGYDRGHLVPVANVSSNNNNILKDTFSLAKVVPQVPSFNAGAWARLEEWVRVVAEEEEEEAETFVLTGPLWLPVRRIPSSDNNKFEYQFEALGRPPRLVHVPTHLFKVVVVVRNYEIIKFAAFVLPNQEQKKENTTTNLQDSLVRWTDLEAVTGMRLFPNLLVTKDFREMADLLTEQEWDKKQEQQLQNEDGLLLLTDGRKQNKSKKKKKKKKAPRAAVDTTRQQTPLMHLCSNGSCQ